MMESQRTSSPKDYGEPLQRNCFIPLMEYQKNSLDSGLTEDGVFNFQPIKEHRSSYSLSDPEYLGSSHNLLIEREHGEITWEPLTMADVNHQEKFKVTLAMVLVELHNLQQWGANVGNAYLQVLTKEKLYIVAGPEFEDSQGHA